MTQRIFHYKELLAFGWRKTKEHFWFLFTVMILGLLVTGASNHVPLVGPLMSIAVGIAAVSILLDIAGGHMPTYRDILKPFRTYHVFLHYVLALLIIAVFVAIAFALVAISAIFFPVSVTAVLSVPLALAFIYWAVRIQFFKYLLVEHPSMHPIASFKKSMRMTDGSFWQLLGFMVLVVLVNIVGALLIGVGLLVTIPLTSIAYTHLYRKLSEHHA
jgi:uncharacterized membrane protein